MLHRKILQIIFYYDNIIINFHAFFVTVSTIIASRSPGPDRSDVDVDAPPAVADAKTSGAAKRQCVAATETDRVFASSPDIDDSSSSSSGELTLGRAKRKPATKTARKRAAPVVKRAAASCAKLIATDVTVVDDVADLSLDASFLTAEPPRVRRVARKRGVPRRRMPPPPGGATARAGRPPGGAIAGTAREEATAVERDVERKSDEETSSKDVCFILYYLSGVQ